MLYVTVAFDDGDSFGDSTRIVSCYIVSLCVKSVH